MNREGFTLIEMIVVIAIIALLVAIMVPSMLSARELARRAVCAANLHLAGTAVANYAADNTFQLMCSQSNRGGEVLPTHIARTHDGDWDQKHDLWLWNIESIDPYTQAFSSGQPSLGGAFVCPSSKPDYWRDKYRDALDLTVIEEGQELIVTPYAYYARVGSWNAAGTQNGAADELIDRYLDAERVLMSDMILLTQIGVPKLHYNHGETGYALPDEGEETPAPVAGANRLYGDGSVRWWQISASEARLIGTEDCTRPHVNETGPWMNTFFY